ncbi:hypothetical protein [Boudabousia marimammalium]|uniref:Uncharacterized protein n=1 Tax=Boudabousia marimammalium TaxID=156892 RepID=A0A1Q5PSB8_9ACTO|nr:hypothetical protein [Boudabousia marimammalium]OKL50456.1 hypothetical protein BM477_00310 [Boudabousia marimammalium]
MLRTRHLRLLLAAVLPLALVLGGCVRGNPLTFPLEGKFLLFESSEDAALTHVTVIDEAGKIQQTGDLLPSKLGFIAANQGAIHLAQNYANQQLTVTPTKTILTEYPKKPAGLGIAAIASGGGTCYYATNGHLEIQDQRNSELMARPEAGEQNLYTVELPLNASAMKLLDEKLYVSGQAISDGGTVLLTIDALTGQILDRFDYDSPLNFEQILPLPGRTLVTLGERYADSGEIYEYRDGKLRSLGVNGSPRLITGDEEEFVYLEGNRLHFAKTADGQTTDSIDLGDVNEFNSAQVQDGKLYLFVTGKAKDVNARFRALTIDLETREKVSEASILVDSKNPFRLGALVPQ